MIVEALVASELVSALLALILVYFFFKAYRFKRALYLLGLLVGFLFLTSSYVFLGMFILNENNEMVSESFLWLRLITQSYGIAFIAFSYYFSQKTEKTMKYFFSIIWIASAISILLFLGTLLVAPPFLELPSTNVLDECFRVVNLVLLGYVIYYLVKRSESSREASYGLVWTSLAFSLLWLAQYSVMIWGIDGSLTAFIFAHVARLASLTLFIGVYSKSGRDQR
jgi:hypothetical protein